MRKNHGDFRCACGAEPLGNHLPDCGLPATFKVEDAPAPAAYDPRNVAVCSTYSDHMTDVRPLKDKVVSAQEQTPRALARQEGGGHYKDLKIQPIEYIHANGIPYMEGNVVKYISRHRVKNGAEDVKKAIHYCQLILQMEYPDVETD